MSLPARTVHGLAVPAFFYGTAWKEERTQALTAQALAVGFRALDTANQRKHYVEAAVGDAVRAAIDAGSVTRAELFLQTKFTYVRGQDHRLPYDPAVPVAEQVAQSFASSHAHLHTDHLDSYVLHGPTHGDGLTDDDWTVWEAMSALQRAGKTRLLGVSNVTLAQLEALWRDAAVKPAFVQNRCYARSGWDAAIRAFCATHDIAYQGFSLLTANRRELEAPKVHRIMSRLGCTLPQLVFRFALAAGMLPLTGSSDAVHLGQDLAAADLSLTADDVATLTNVARG
jgi:diketogulonate reductase-like aldo/keto reductase